MNAGPGNKKFPRPHTPYPLEVFSVTRLDEDQRREEPSPYEVLIITY